MVDVAMVPERLEDAVGEAQDEDVLDGLLARGSGRSGRSASRGRRRAARVQVPAGREVVAERLLDDRPHPAVLDLREPLGARSPPRSSRRRREAWRSRRCGCAGRRAPPRSARASRCRRRKSSASPKSPATYDTRSGRSPGRPCVGGVNSRAPPSRCARNASSVYGERPMPTIAKSGERAPSRFRWAMAGASRRRVRSPEAPKMTSVAGGRISSSRRGAGAAAEALMRPPRGRPPP